MSVFMQEWLVRGRWSQAELAGRSIAPTVRRHRIQLTRLSLRWSSYEQESVVAPAPPSSRGAMLARRALLRQVEVACKPSRVLFQPPQSPSRRHNATAIDKKPKLVDLSRELYHRSPAHPFHPPVCITQWDTHQPKKAGNTVLRSASYALSMSDHAGTHVDAPKHFDPTPGALAINEMPLEDFYTEAICLDLSHVELKATISVKEMEEALEKSGQEIKQGDTVLVYMAFNKRIPFDDPRWQHDFPGLSLKAVYWLADKGCKIFGVEVSFNARDMRRHHDEVMRCDDLHRSYADPCIAGNQSCTRGRAQLPGAQRLW